MNTSPFIAPVKALVTASIEYRVICDITFIRCDNTTRTITGTVPYDRTGGRFSRVFDSLEAATAGLEVAKESGTEYEDYIVRRAAEYPEVYDLVLHHNYRLVRRECTQWHS